jgi:hypothetical protein
MTEAPQATPTDKKFTPLSFAVLLLLLIGLPLAGLAFIWKDRCHSSVATTLESPAGDFAVEQIVTDCGATMRTASEIKLRKLGVPDREEATVLLLPQKDPLPLRFTDGKTLEITVPPQAEIAKRLLEWSGIRIMLAGGPLKPSHPKLDSRVPELNPQIPPEPPATR